MNDRVWWASALQWTLWWIAMFAVMGWLGRSRLKPRPASEARTLRHSRGILILGLVCFGFFSALTVISNVFPNETVTWWTTAIFVGFALMGVPLVIEYYKVRLELSEQGMVYWTYLRGRRTLRWEDVREVRFSPAMRWFRLETRNGEVARVSAMLIGLPEFANLLLAHVPAEAVDEQTLALLRATAVGALPPVW